MKMLFTTDLHGSAWKYERLFKIAKRSNADVVINSGDMLPKNGDLFSQDKFITGYLNNHFDRFEAARIHYLCYLGNDDLRIWDDLFKGTCNRYEFIHDIAQQKMTVGQIEFIGMNWVVDYPFRLKDRCRIDYKGYVFQPQFGKGVLSSTSGWKELDDWFEYAYALPSIADELETLIRPDNMENSIFVMHMPPDRLKLDVCGDGREVGSRSIYEYLQKYQPRLSLHGHIHESPLMSGTWKAMLGKTLCVQPGQLDSLVYVVIDSESMEIERFTESL